MSLADIQNAFAQQPASQPAAAPAAPAAQPIPAAAIPPGTRPILTVFGIAFLPETSPLPQGAQYIDPATGRPYPPLNPPGEASALAYVAPQAAPAQPSPVSAPSPFAPAPTPQLQTVQTPVIQAPSPFQPQVAAVAPQNAASAPSPFLAAPAPTPAADAPPTIVMPDPAPKARPRTRRGSSATGASGPTPGAEGAEHPAAVHEYAHEGLGAFSTEDLRNELARRGWSVALGERA